MEKNKNLSFLYSATIEYVEMNRYHHFLLSFDSLKYLYCEDIKEANDKLFLCNLKQLNELHFQKSPDKLSAFQYQKTKYKRDNLEIFLNGLELACLAIARHNYN